MINNITISNYHGSRRAIKYWSLYCKDIPNWSSCLLSLQLLLQKPVQFVASSLVHQPFRCLNSNTASITKVHRKMYAQLYPTTVILSDGSSFSIRYHEPRKIIKVFYFCIILLKKCRDLFLFARSSDVFLHCSLSHSEYLFLRAFKCVKPYINLKFSLIFYVQFLSYFNDTFLKQPLIDWLTVEECVSLFPYVYIALTEQFLLFFRKGDYF